MSLFPLCYGRRNLVSHLQIGGSISYPTCDLVIPSSLKFLMSNIISIVTVSLAAYNYNIWNSQIIRLFIANGYFPFLDDTSQCPAKFNIQPSGETTPNPNYNTWQLLDQNLVAALLSTISTSILPYVLNLNSTTEIWTTLIKRLQSTNRSRVIQLKNELYHIPMKSQSMTQYLSEIKSIVDQLTAAGSPIDIEDIILYTLNGLLTSYQSFKTVIHTSADPINLDDLYSLLCSEETNLQAEHNKELSSSHLALHSNRVRHPLPYQCSRGRSTSLSGRRGTSAAIGGYHINTSLPTCQICDKVGHTTNVCWHRGNFDYIPVKKSSPNTAFYADSSASTIQAPATEWLLDSEASSHLTNNLEHL